LLVVRARELFVSRLVGLVGCARLVVDLDGGRAGIPCLA
jgi:hypothetical protein